jgi:hypothetical protein
MATLFLARGRVGRVEGAVLLLAYGVYAALHAIGGADLRRWPVSSGAGRAAGRPSEPAAAAGQRRRARHRPGPARRRRGRTWSRVVVHEHPVRVLARHRGTGEPRGRVVVRHRQHDGVMSTVTASARRTRARSSPTRRAYRRRSARRQEPGLRRPPVRPGALDRARGRRPATVASMPFQRRDPACCTIRGTTEYRAQRAPPEGACLNGGSRCDAGAVPQLYPGPSDPGARVPTSVSSGWRPPTERASAT